MSTFQKGATLSARPQGAPSRECGNSSSDDSRERLPATRRSITHKFTINGYDGYIIVGLFEDERPGEVFLKMAKQGSTLAGFLNTVGILTSLCLQYGVPVCCLARKFEHMRFEPSGWTPNQNIKEAASIVDYIFRWLDLTFPAKGHSTVEQNLSLFGNLTDLDSPNEKMGAPEDKP